VSNGGPGFAYGIYPLEKTNIVGDITKECTCFPFMTYEDFKAIDERQQAIYEADDRSEEDLFYDGLLTIGTEGCTYDTCIVVTGKYRGRLVSTDLNEEGPFYFIYDDNFLDWYERWLDDFIAGIDMGSFGGSVAGSQKELRVRFHNENNPDTKRAILVSLGRFPQIEPETITLWEDVCKSEFSSGIYYAALWELINKHAPNTADIMQEFFYSTDEKRDVCIKLLRLAAKNGVDIEPFIPKLLEIMPKLTDLFSNAVWAIQQTSYNKYATFLPFLDLPDNNRKITIFWVPQNTPDRNSEDFVSRIPPFFNDGDINIVRQAILSLMEIKDDRVPPLVDEAYKRFPEFEPLRKNYYRRTWGKNE